MRYGLLLSPEAQSDLARIDLALLDEVEYHLRQLADHPATLSRPARLPYPPGSQVYEFDLYDSSNIRHHFAVMFRYGTSEDSLHILRIGHHQMI
jgi:hypothetical protein